MVLLKITILIILFVCGIQNLPSSGLLEKFNQHGYKIKDNLVKVFSYNNETINFLTAMSFKYNRTTTAHNLTVNLKIDVRDEVQVVVQDYKFLSNEYRIFPVRFQLNLCKALNANVLGALQVLHSCGNVSACNFQKDVTYHVCNFVIDDTKGPPNFPSGRYLSEIIATYKTHHLATVGIYGEVYTPIEHP